MGTGVFGGMLLATFVATLFIPLFFVLLTRRARTRARNRRAAGAGVRTRPRREARGTGEPSRVLALLLAGCMVGPDYQRPAIDVPAAYPDAASVPGTGAAAPRRLVDAVRRSRVERARHTALAEQHRRAAGRRADRGSRRQPARGGRHACSRRSISTARRCARASSFAVASPPAPGTPSVKNDIRLALLGLVRDRLLGQAAARRRKPRARRRWARATRRKW